MKTGRPLLGITRKGRKGSFWIAEKKSFSSAISFLILSSEEAIKTTLILLHCGGFKV